MTFAQIIEGVQVPLKRALLEHEARVVGRPFDLFA